jgi:hypothetical protein
MAYNHIVNNSIEFCETSIFTSQITEVISDDAYRLLQGELIKDPNLGKVIPPVAVGYVNSVGAWKDGEKAAGCELFIFGKKVIKQY